MGPRAGDSQRRREVRCYFPDAAKIAPDQATRTFRNVFPGLLGGTASATWPQYYEARMVVSERAWPGAGRR